MDYEKLEGKLHAVGIEYNSTRETLTSYATDESIFSITPKLVVFPQSAEEIEEMVKMVNEARGENNSISLTARAAGTGLSGGSLNDSVIVDTIKYLNKMDAVERVSDEVARVRTQPGVMFRDFDTATKKEGFFLPPYPSSRDICTVGGMVANNAAGPNSLEYGHTAEFVSALKVVLKDGNEYELYDLSYDELMKEVQRSDFLGEMYREIWKKIQESFEIIQNSKPTSSKNSSGYLLWNVLKADSLEAFAQGEGTFSLVPLFVGSQGTLGIITEIEFSLIPNTTMSDLLVVPIQNVTDIGEVIEHVLEHKPCNVEIFDDKTYNPAVANPGFFLKQFYAKSFFSYLLFLWNFYTNHWFVFKGKTPAFVLLVTFDAHTKNEANKGVQKTVHDIQGRGFKVYHIKSSGIAEMFWKIRFASFSLAKLGKKNVRPAAFLEDIVVPPKNLPDFLTGLMELLKKYNADYAMHGHGGNGHFHFYPLFDFTDPETPRKIKDMADDFFWLAEKHEGNICGEHNDGIIRTPYMRQVFSSEILELFENMEHTFDPVDIFNPGKKVHPKFEILSSIRKVN